MNDLAGITEPSDVICAAVFTVHVKHILMQTYTKTLFKYYISM